jgi:putative transposase
MGFVQPATAGDSWRLFHFSVIDVKAARSYPLQIVVRSVEEKASSKAKKEAKKVAEKAAEKRKRGRPKGSKNKTKKEVV